MTTTITRRITMVEEACCSCGFPFMVPDYFMERCQKKARAFYCPACRNSMWYGESEADKLKKQIANHASRTEFWMQQTDELSRHLDAERKHHASTKGQLTKTRKRVGHGVCPCCNRQFQNLRRHMAAKHPEMV